MNKALIMAAVMSIGMLSGCARPDLTEPVIKARQTTISIAETTTKESVSSYQIRKNVLRLVKSEMSSPDSAGGVSVNIDIKNASDMEIKYVYFDVQFLNRVGDVVSDDIDGEKNVRLQMVGPIKAGESGGIDEHWDSAFYNSTADSFAIKNIDIEYINGKVLSINQDDVDSNLLR